MSHFDRDAVEDLKLIKLDLLSVRGLAAISETKAGLGPADDPADGDAGRLRPCSSRPGRSAASRSRARP